MADYMATLREVFDFALLRDFLARPDFSLVFDAMHAVTGAYAGPILVDALGAPASSILCAHRLPPAHVCFSLRIIPYSAAKRWVLLVRQSTCRKFACAHAGCCISDVLVGSQCGRGSIQGLPEPGSIIGRSGGLSGSTLAELTSHCKRLVQWHQEPVSTCLSCLLLIKRQACSLHQGRHAAGGLWRRAPGPEPDVRARAGGAAVGRGRRGPGCGQRRRRRSQHDPGPQVLRDAQRQRGHDRRQRAAVHPLLCRRAQGRRARLLVPQLPWAC